MKEAIPATFRGAFEAIMAKGKPDLPLKPWLSILAVRYCMPVMERRRQEFLAQAKELEELARHVPVLQEITRDDRERVNFMVRGEIDDIPEPHKQILAMHEMDGLNILEMAKRLNAAWVTVLSRLYNARLALRDRVQAQFKA
jgi:DNA-directed RNA polymerase specialized sigma24 family protein